ncbi:MAG: alpha/beta fold hydrolase [Alphaproteobacteria bacterium]|nr:alpha/beta fold hydrolase [Alphaproteobacteria bacterium]
MNRRSRIRYEAPILGGYEMTADIAASDAEWRVVAIPGTPSRPHMFSRFLREAPTDIEVVVPNRAGYGGPLWGPKARPPVLSFDDQIGAIAPLFDRDDGKKTIALGVSYGGLLALKAALDYPGRVFGVVTVAALVTEPRSYVAGAMQMADWPGFKHLLPRYAHNARAEVEGRRAQIGPLFERLKLLSVPVTIMHGDLDTLVALSDARALGEKFRPGADVAFDLVRGGTHYLELQTPQRLFDAVRDVIARAERRAGLQEIR